MAGSPSIEQIVAQIRTALFGKDVRENIALGIEKCYEDTQDNAKKSDVVNNTTTTVAGKILDARQGKVLNDKFANYILTSKIANDVNTTEAGKVLDARQGKVLNDRIGSFASTSSVIERSSLYFPTNRKNIAFTLWKEGYYVNQATGEIGVNVSYKATDYIKIDPNTNYTISALPNVNGLRYAVYSDANETSYISGDNTGVGVYQYTLLTPANAKYIRFSLATVDTKIQMEKGTTATDYADPAPNPASDSRFIDYYEYNDFTRIFPESLDYHVGLINYVGQIFTGDIYDNYVYFFLPVKPGDVFLLNEGYIRSKCIYNNGAVVTSQNDNNITKYIVPDGVDEIAITIAKMYMSSIKLYYHYYSENSISPSALARHVPSIAKDAVSSSKQLVRPENTTFFVVSRNMTNPATEVVGEYVNQVTGEFQQHTLHTRTDYLLIKPSTKYFTIDNYNGVSGYRYAFYDSDRVFIQGSGGYVYEFDSPEDHIITSPANAKWLVVSYGFTSAGMFSVAEYDNDSISFEPYGEAYIPSKYFVNQIEDALINLPNKIYALVGYELNVYFENITEQWDKYSWDVVCSVGQQTARGYNITPESSEVGTYSLTIKATSNGYSISKTVSLIVTAASAGSGQTASVIILGDSTTNSGFAVTKLNDNFSSDVMNVTTLGTRGTSPNNHEGRAGWKFSDYFGPSTTQGVENPWYNPTSQTFDASYYFSHTGIAKPNWLFINLGINDTFSYNDDDSLEAAVTDIKNKCNAMITSIRNASSSTKVGLCLTIPPNHSQDAFGKAYKCGQTRDRYKRNNTLFVHDMITSYDNRESEGIYIIPIHTNLDTIYNMGLETIPVNARNTEVTYQSPVANGGVHPSELGYWQIADVYTAFLKAHA